MSYLYEDDGEPCVDRKIFLATTAYDSPDATYTFSIQRSREALHKAGLPTAYYLLQGNCHVDDARNSIVSHFLSSDCTDLVFLDADVSWTPKDLLKLCSHDVDLVGGVYPFRRDDKSDEMPVRMLNGAEEQDGLLEVEGLPTGFMRIRRKVFDSIPHEVFTGKKGEVIPLYFERTLEHGTRWGGDLNFCNKWRATGGKLFADVEMVLGHTAKIVIKGSLGHLLRRKGGTTLRHVCEKIKNNAHTMADLTEARDYIANPYGAPEDFLAVAVSLARDADGPIIEAGSGLTTVLMAAANPDQIVYCLEHHGVHVAKLKQMAAEAGVGNIGLCVCGIKDSWYDLSDMDDLPKEFALGLIDGPPRQIGNRARFFKHFSPENILCDDADDKAYMSILKSAAPEYAIHSLSERTAIACKNEQVAKTWQQRSI